MRKPTVKDVADAAGVSLATVDRVLNDRPGVRRQTVERVTAAIAATGFVRDISAANLARQRLYRFAFILPDKDSEFIAALKEAVMEAGIAQAPERTVVRITPVPANDPHQIVRVLQGIGPSNTDGVAIMAPETPHLRDAISHLKSQGIFVVALVANQPNAPCDHFVGINNQAAGRTAGTLMGRFCAGRSGRVLVLAESMQSRDTLERRLGFDEILAAEYPALQVAPSLETYGDRDRAGRVLTAAIAGDPAVVGLYIIGSGVRRALEVLDELGCAREMVIIAHDLTPYTRARLEDRTLDAVITQDVGHLVRSALRVLRAKCDGSETIQSQERIRIEIVLRENMG